MLLTMPPSATEAVSLMLVTLPHTLAQPMWLPMLPQLLPTPSMPQLSTLQLPTLCTQPQLLPTLSTPPQLTTPPPQLTRLRLTLMRSPPTPTPTPLLMTTPSPTSMLRNNLTV